MFKKSVVAMLIVLPMSAFAHGHGGHGGMGGHNFGGHGHGGNIGHAFGSHSFGGKLAGRMNASGGFTGFSKGSINMSDHPVAQNIADHTTHTASFKDGTFMGTTTTTIGDITRETSTVVSADMRSHTKAITNGEVSHVSIRSYADGIGGLSVHATKDGDTAIGTVKAYNDVANAGVVNHMLKSGDMTRVAQTAIAPDFRSRTVAVRDDTGVTVHMQGYVGNEQVGIGYNKHVATYGEYGFERSVNTLGIATVGMYGPAHYAEKVANLKTGTVKTITDITPPAPTPVVIHVVPLTPLTPVVPQPTPVVIHVAPAADVTPAVDPTPANVTTVYNDKHGDSVILYWNI